ncbi:MAG TPA: flagellar biosynthesis protein FlhA [Burkholderiales bacterium]|nr:flagellar biosynthesis protein FlhA [Burkholderiales bacterium]
MAAAAATSRLPISTRHLNVAAGPVLIIMIMAMMVLPLPPFALDVLFTFNIALSIMVMLVALYTVRPLDFSIFPTVLLITTLLRLSLNVASTRVVLLQGHTGGDAAGKVIEAFGHFMIGGNYAVGLVVFIILVVINFVVVTKGAGRIAEVGARFTLDAMPGKQMAIDADLNAGLIGEDVARKRRAEIAQEADFYGAMDGASKFVRGDAIAGILVMLINVVGGLVVGIIQHDMSIGDAARNYILLAIGDGLVAQIPALVISVAAGIVVSRVGSEEPVGEQFVGQLLRKPEALAITAGIIGVLGIVPGMPHVAFLLLAAIMGAIAYTVRSALAKQADAPPPPPPAEAKVLEAQDASWSDVTPVDTLGLEVGYRLIPLVDQGQDGELLRRIKGIRRKFAQEIGFLPPSVHIRDNLELKPGAYRIALKGVEVGRGEAMPGHFLAINPGRVSGTLQGTVTTDPAFGLPAVWIESGQREHAQVMGYTVVDASTVVATHLNHVVQQHAAELLGRQEVQQLLDHLAKDAPKLVEDLVPKTVSLAVLQKTLQSLLEEGVHIRDMRSILETIAEHGTRTQDPHELAAQVRIALGRAIAQQVAPAGNEVQVVALSPDLERLLVQAMQVGGSPGIEPGLADALATEAAAASTRLEQLGHSPVLLVAPQLRSPLSRFLRRTIPQLRVLAHTEIPDNRKIRVASILGGKS